MSPEEEKQFQESNFCWLCEKPFSFSVDLEKSCEKPFNSNADKVRDREANRMLVRDHDHLTGKYREAAHNICNINCKQQQSSFVPIIFHNFTGYDCHNMFEELLSQAFAVGIEPKKYLSH